MKLSCSFLEYVLLATILSATAIYAKLQVAVEGPHEVAVGQTFEYNIHLVGMPEDKDSGVLMYYIPPKQLECVESECSNNECFEVQYCQDLRRVYGQGINLSENEDIAVRLTMKVCGTSKLALEEQEDSPSYFIFFTCKDNGEDTEFYKRVGLKINNVESPGSSE